MRLLYQSVRDMTGAILQSVLDERQCGRRWASSGCPDLVMIVIMRISINVCCR